MYSRKEVKVGNVYIGGNHPISIQSMTNTNTADVEKTVKQIINLSNAGAELVRVSVRTLEDINPLKEILKNTNIPLIADIHFDYRVAIESIKAGISKIRLNPGNIGSKEKVKEVVKVAKEYKIPIRVGANSGSIDKNFIKLDRWKAIAESALEEVKLLENEEFNDIVISLKSSDARETYLANKYVKEKVDYPLHVGITEAGVYEDSLILSSAGIGSMLLNNIGDTIRISMAGDPIKEVIAAKKLLTLLGLKKGIRVIACPTCARTEYNVEETALYIKSIVEDFEVKKDYTIAVMGCVVNGPGEASHADLAIAGSKNKLALYKKGKLLNMVNKENIKEEILKIIKESFGD
ncbi:4-hydroxy-3-methylbut-2-en-1-yl diphosphate synthase [Tepiditoga spiralis]|uniref:4-hydroxy-3-methylbut-2-en-1-yl diphosphate synthase (flavodoxin) n=1 Tax=Tepiditoga spiralis TaxID=2108365 RepID=A0A7G1G4F3_9BACT|nr:flavodoxin-dependent (E)-4-hydroxy-3-methylbut-2-enyl-diphosphate synthase [Tepiditoga spiralis]BBE31388.1 4-hydroxy-3-methylbut-2-en-1-yl diphosphate synthase [Tepiditoga spiralis]